MKVWILCKVGLYEHIVKKAYGSFKKAVKGLTLIEDNMFGKTYEDVNHMEFEIMEMEVE